MQICWLQRRLGKCNEPSPAHLSSASRSSVKHPLQPSINVNASFVLSRRACAQSVAIPDVVEGFGSRLIASANDGRTRATRHDVVGTAVGAHAQIGHRSAVRTAYSYLPASGPFFLEVIKSSFTTSTAFLLAAVAHAQSQLLPRPIHDAGQITAEGDAVHLLARPHEVERIADDAVA